MKKVLAMICCMIMVFTMNCPVSLAEDNVLTLVTAADCTGIGFPAAYTGGYERLYSEPAIESLARLNRDGTITPWLAKEINVDNEALEIDVILNEGIFFSDGTPFNAEAVVKNWNYYQENGTNKMGNVESYEAVGEFEVKVKLNAWNNSTLFYLFVECGREISPTFYEENGLDVCYGQPVGTGPFVLSQFDAGSYIAYTKNENYWIEGCPKMDGIEFVICSESTTAKTIYLNGEADVFLFPATTDSMELMALGQSVTGNSDVYPSSAYGITFASGNADDPVGNLLVRQAICYAIDNEAITAAYTGGLGTATNQLAVVGSGNFNEDVQGYPYNPEKAKELLAEAGYADGCTVTMTYQPGNEELFVMIQAYLNAVGINTNMDVVDSATYGNKWVNSSTDPYTSIIFYAGGTVKENWGNGLGSKAIWGNKPWDHSADPIIDDCLDTIMYSTDEAAISDAIDLMQKTVIDDYCLALPIYTSTYVMFESDDVKDSGLLTEYRVSWTPEAVYVEK